MVLTLVARPIAVWLCLGPFGFTRNEKAFVSWVGLRGAVSIFLAAIPQLAGLPAAPIYFNIAFFVVLVSLLVQGSTLNAAARRLGVALRRRGAFGDPGRDRHPRPDRAGDRRLPGDRREHHPRPQRGCPAWARIVMVVRKGHILEPAEAGPLQRGDYAYFLVSRQRLPRLDSLFRSSPDVARRLGLIFGELAIRGETRIDEVASLYDLDFGPHAARGDGRATGWRRGSTAGRRSTPRSRSRGRR